MMRRRQREFLEGAASAEAQSAAIWERLEAMPAFWAADCVLLYMAMPGEPLTEAFIGRWHGRKRIVLPVVVGDGLELREYDPELLKEGYMGIWEPSEAALPVNPSEVDLAVVPGVAFAPMDGAVVRLGHGGGFYDRLLPRLDCPLIGVGYSFRLVDSLPADPWDVRLDGAIIP